MRFAIFVAGCVACGGGGILEPVNVVAPVPQGIAEVGELFVCPDLDLNDQLTTGGRRVTNFQPCYTVGPPPATDRREQIVSSYEEQSRHREYEVDRTLALDEQAACSGVPLIEGERSPLVDRRSIDKVEPVQEDGQLVGVRVVFKPVRGLTAEALRRDIACQRARWESLGETATWRPDDPTLVSGVHWTVLDRAGHVELFVTAPTPEQASVALSRARNTHAEQTARR
jgi:hypothetical protein